MDTIADPDNGIYITIPAVNVRPGETAEHVDRWGGEEAVVAVCVVPIHVEPPFGHRSYDPIYEACERVGLPVVYHSAGSATDYYHLRGFQTNIATNTLGFLVTLMNTITSVVVQGGPERFPDLDLVFEEAGLFWIPMMMYWLDQYYLMMSDEPPLPEKRRSEYMKECYNGIQPMEAVPDSPYFEYVFEMLGGADRLLFSTDWPHIDFDERTVITDLAFLSENEKRKILRGNAEVVFDI